MKLVRIVSVLIMYSLCSCIPNVDENLETESIGDTDIMSNLTIPRDFNFQTTRNIRVTVDVMSIENKPLKGVKVGFFNKHPDENGKLLTSAFTDSFGKIDTQIRVPSYFENIFIQVYSIGFANQKTIPVINNTNVTFGGFPEQRTTVSNKQIQNPIPILDNYYYMGNFNGNGLPLYLEDNGDNLTQDFLDGVNASLPENKPVPQNNPEYLSTGNELDVVVLERSDVWVTFVTEGAGYRNALGYYVFDSQDPPSSVNEIDSIHVILPNASLANAGGELIAGDKIKLGTFEAGQTISWVLFQNAWNGTNVNVNATKFYSRSEFNTVETNPEMRQHTVQLADFGRQLLLNGFEDQTRSKGSDNDFNDLVFYVSANPWENILIGDIPAVTPNTDSDGDGISDETDDFPDDPTRAIKNTYIGSLAFEDLWPSKGDYDFNDLVLDYEIDHILNGDNQLVSIESDWTIKAVFAGYANGFGITFENLSPSEIANITGLHHTENTILQNGNGTESNQDKATVIIFDNVFSAVQASGSPYPHTSPVTKLSNTINFINPISQDLVGFPPYSPFIFANGNRSTEIHLPGHFPTDLANSELFGTFADDSNFNLNYTYKTANGLPWGIHLSEPFDFPKEGSAINEAYLNFVIWATSGGSLGNDWYLDLPNYRNSTHIYE